MSDGHEYVMAFFHRKQLIFASCRILTLYRYIKGCAAGRLARDRNRIFAFMSPSKVYVYELILIFCVA